MKHFRTFESFEETDVIDLEDIDISDIFDKKLVVYNDDVNTFDHVISTLIKVLKHTNQQAEQCAVIIHTKGKCSVKSGSYKELKKYKDILIDAGLKTIIE